VEVEMEDRLACIRAVVSEESIAIGDSLFDRYPRGHFYDFTDQGQVVGFDALQAWDLFFRHDEDVDAGDRRRSSIAKIRSFSNTFLQGIFP
jgi:hypothetical protein